MLLLRSARMREYFKLLADTLSMVACSKMVRSSKLSTRSFLSGAATLLSSPGEGVWSMIESIRAESIYSGSTCTQPSGELRYVHPKGM